jgi:hypothetical protein
VKKLAMWSSDQRTEFVLTENSPAPGECKKATGGSYYGVSDPEGVAMFVDKVPLKATRTDTLEFIIENAWGVPAKRRARYMQLFTFCLFNAFSAREQTEG